MSGFFLIPKKGTGGGAEAIPLIVTCSSDFAGLTITASDGTSTLTEICPSSSPYEVTFILPNDGTWTISGTISGQTFTTSILIEPYETILNAIPEGSTVLPTDDVQTWLNCAGIFDKAYTTISQVLSDSSSVTALIASNNAVDYMARSTTWTSDVCADSSAMTKIGANDYCANKLLADSTWLNAICNSTYFESVLNAKVPTMTSNTAPSGIASQVATSAGNSYAAYLAFDGNDTTYNGITPPSTTISGSTSCWIQYNFGYAFQINKLLFNYLTSFGSSTSNITKIQISGSNDGSTWNNIANINVSSNNASYSIQNTTKYQIIRVYVKDGSFNNPSTLPICIKTLQLYGRS